MTSRGCPFHCRFCNTHVIHKTFRQRSAENVVKELQEIQDRYKSVMIADDNFLADKKRAIKIMEGIIQEKVDLDLFISGVRVDSAERHLYTKMKKAGVKFISFGIESGNQDILDYYNKKVTLSQIRKAVNLAKEMKFITMANFIFGAPIETKNHVDKTIKFSLSLPLDYAVFRRLSYQFGTELWKEAVEAGKINENEKYFYYADSRKKLSNFSKEELNEYCKKAFKRFYLRPTYIINAITKSIMRKDFNMIKVLYPFI
jgi:radical SAM superfamily enzyme YgiQ (UPF0313 family)